MSGPAGAINSSTCITCTQLTVEVGGGQYVSECKWTVKQNNNIIISHTGGGAQSICVKEGNNVF